MKRKTYIKKMRAYYTALDLVAKRHPFTSFHIDIRDIEKYIVRNPHTMSYKERFIFNANEIKKMPSFELLQEAVPTLFIVV